jgi:hypothetical protein
VEVVAVKLKNVELSSLLSDTARLLGEAGEPNVAQMYDRWAAYIVKQNARSDISGAATYIYRSQRWGANRLRQRYIVFEDGLVDKESSHRLQDNLRVLDSWCKEQLSPVERARIKRDPLTMGPHEVPPTSPVPNE